LKKNTVEIDGDQFKDAQLYNPTFDSGFRDFSLKIDNPSGFRILAVKIGILNLNNKVWKFYKLYADSPIEPLTIGTLEGPLLTNGDNVENFAKFSKENSWRVISAFGVKLE
jgi:hypothetical protein